MRFTFFKDDFEANPKATSALIHSFVKYARREILGFKKSNKSEAPKEGETAEGEEEEDDLPEIIDDTARAKFTALLKHFYDKVAKFFVEMHKVSNSVSVVHSGTLFLLIFFFLKKCILNPKGALSFFLLFPPTHSFHRNFKKKKKKTETLKTQRANSPKTLSPPTKNKRQNMTKFTPL